MQQIRKFLLLLSLLLSTSRSDVTASIRRNPHAAQSGELHSHERFRDLVSKNYVFADKSLLIKDFVESPHKVALVTCPKNWGKSINLDMIKTFLQPEYAYDKKVGKTDAFNYKLFELGETDSGKIAPLAVTKHRAVLDKYLGQWPVVHISLAAVESTDFKFIVKVFKRALRPAFEEHKYLHDVFLWQSNAKSANESEKKTAKEQHAFFKKCQDVDLKEGTAEEAIQCLKFLCESLHKHFGNKPFILIDDYDRPLKYFFYWFQPGFDQQVIDQTIKLLHQFMTAILSNNDHFEKALITAVMSLEIPRVFAGLPDLKRNNMVKNDFYKHYGLTDDEVSLLFKECKVKGKLADDAKAYYGGYTVANDKNTSLYNFRSINGFLGAKKVGNFWTQTSNAFAFAPLYGNEVIKPVLDLLVDRKSFLVDLNHLMLTTDDYVTLDKMSNGKEKVTETGVNLFLMFIFSEGYLTLDKRQVEETASAHAHVVAPNNQTVEQLKKRKEWSISDY